jgi:glycosyltransferase involved in cell wall biosynthesis
MLRIKKTSDKGGIKTALFLVNKGNRRQQIQIQALEEAGLNPRVIVFEDFPSNNLIKKGHGDKIIYLSKTRNEGFRRFSLSLIWELVKILNRENIRIVLTQRWRLVKYLVLAKLFYPKLKIIYYIVIGGRFKRFRRRLGLRVLSPFIDQILVNSSALKEEILKYKIYPAHKLDILYSAVDPSEFEINLSKREIRKRFGLPEDLFLYGMIAYFRKEKDQEGLIKTLAEVLREVVSAGLVLVGDGPNFEKCKALARDLGIEDKVFFAGKRPLEEVPLWLKAMDAYVYATFREGMPLAVLEAMAAGLPIIATSAEGLPDIFHTNLLFGYLVPIGDYEALKKAMQEIYFLSPETLQNFGANAKKRLLEGFSVEQLKKKTISIFKNLLENIKD